MTCFACFNFNFTWADVLLILGITFGISSLLVGGVSFVISRVFALPLWKILGGEAIAFAIVAMVFGVMGNKFEGHAFLSLFGLATCLLLMGVRLLVNWLKETIGLNNRRELCSLNLVDEPVADSVQ